MSAQQPVTSTEASVSHLIIFNPDLKPAPKDDPTHQAQTGPEGGEEAEERDRDLEDDMKEASQILFYTSRSGGKVSRDTMLRQFGLAKGLMGFTDMVLENDGGKSGWWGIHSSKSRMIIYSPEEGFYIYINISLASQSAGETTHTSQGLLDQMIVDDLKRGYEDFRLLHGPLPSLIPPSPSTSSALDRFWTNFAFQFESTYLSPTDPGSLLSTWLGGYPIHSTIIPSNPLDDEMEKEMEGIDSGLIGREGPLHPLSSEMDTSLIRFLVHRLRTSLPPPPAPTLVTPTNHAERSSLGLGFGLGGRRKKPIAEAGTGAGASGGRNDDSRSSSSTWTSWVPSIGLGLPKDSQDGDKTLHPPSGPGPGSEPQSRWPSFGLGGVGTVFGLGKSPAEITSPSIEHKSDTIKQPLKEVTQPSETEAGQREGDAESVKDVHGHGVEQSEVAVKDLQEAVQAEDEIELSWEKKDIWLKSPSPSSADESEAVPGKVGYEKRRVAWIIRDETLLYVLYPRTSGPPYYIPSTFSTLGVFASLAPKQTRASIDSVRSARSVRPSTPTAPGNAYIYSSKQVTVTHDTIDTAALQTLTELKDRISSDTTIHEVYAKTSGGRFVVAKKSTNGVGELYLQIGRKDASLTDAEHAVRSVGRIYPDLSVEL